MWGARVRRGDTRTRKIHTRSSSAQPGPICNPLARWPLIGACALISGANQIMSKGDHRIHHFSMLLYAPPSACLQTWRSSPTPCQQSFMLPRRWRTDSCDSTRPVKVGAKHGRDRRINVAPPRAVSPKLFDEPHPVGHYDAGGQKEGPRARKKDTRGGKREVRIGKGTRATAQSKKDRRSRGIGCAAGPMTIFFNPAIISVLTLGHGGKGVVLCLEEIEQLHSVGKMRWHFILASWLMRSCILRPIGRPVVCLPCWRGIAPKDVAQCKIIGQSFYTR